MVERRAGPARHGHAQGESGRVFHEQGGEGEEEGGPERLFHHVADRPLLEVGVSPVPPDRGAQPAHVLLGERPVETQDPAEVLPLRRLHARPLSLLGGIARRQVNEDEGGAEDEDGEEQGGGGRGGGGRGGRGGGGGGPPRRKR